MLPRVWLGRRRVGIEKDAGVDAAAALMPGARARVPGACAAALVPPSAASMMMAAAGMEESGLWFCGRSRCLPRSFSSRLGGSRNSGVAQAITPHMGKTCLLSPPPNQEDLPAALLSLAGLMVRIPCAQ